MTIVKEQQADQRWDTLPDVLRDALVSSANSDFVWKTSEEQHLTDEKIYPVARVVGYVLMGFLHPDDAAQEIKDATQIDIKVAQTIADAVNQRIFAPLRADIDRVYQPAGAMSMGGPKMMNDIGAPAPRPPTGPAAMPISNIPPKPPAGSLSDKGWSRIAPGGPTLQFNASQIAPPPAPPKAAPIVPPVSQPKPAAAAPGAMSEFDRLGLAKNPPSPGIPPAAKPLTPAAPVAPAAPAAGPAPMMLHEDTTFKATQTAPDFRLSRPDEAARVNLDVAKSAPMPLKAAVLELGNSTGPSSATPAAPNAPGRMVHYTELSGRASTGPGMAMPAANTGERHVTEITSAPAPMPPKPPTPPAPPAPPAQPGQPPAPGAEKVISKNYP